MEAVGAPLRWVETRSQPVQVGLHGGVALIADGLAVGERRLHGRDDRGAGAGLREHLLLRIHRLLPRDQLRPVPDGARLPPHHRQRLGVLR